MTFLRHDEVPPVSMNAASVLLVEDEPLTARQIEKWLTNLGYEVVGSVDSGEAAISIAQETQPDLLLMDILLKGELTGIDAAEVIVERMKVPIIFMTVHDERDYLEKAKLAGPSGYLLKPYTQKELHVAIETALSRHALEKRLFENGQWLHATLNSIGEGVMAVDSEGRVVFMNSMARLLTNGHSRDPQGLLLTELLHFEIGDGPVELSDSLKIVARQKRTAVFEEGTVLVGRDGRRTPVEGTISPILGEDGVFLGNVVVVRDVTDRCEVQEQLREYQTKLRSLAAISAEIEERERKRLSEALHDRVGQNLAVAKLLLAGSVDRPETDESRSNLAQVQGLLDETLKSTQALIFDLSPPLLHELGLEDAVEWLAENVLSPAKIRYKLDLQEGDSSMDPETRDASFKAIRELMTNVVRHADADRVWVSVYRNEGVLHGSVRDNGKGFEGDPDAIVAEGGDGMGLFGLKERLSYLKGTLNLLSKPKGGTTVSFTVPLRLGERTKSQAEQG